MLILIKRRKVLRRKQRMPKNSKSALVVNIVGQSGNEIPFMSEFLSRGDVLYGR